MPPTSPFDPRTFTLAGLALAWEAPLTGWRFVTIRVPPSLAFPLIAGWRAKLRCHE